MPQCLRPFTTRREYTREVASLWRRQSAVIVDAGRRLRPHAGNGCWNARAVRSRSGCPARRWPHASCLAAAADRWSLSVSLTGHKRAMRQHGGSTWDDRPSQGCSPIGASAAPNVVARALRSLACQLTSWPTGLSAQAIRQRWLSYLLVRSARRRSARPMTCRSDLFVCPRCGQTTVGAECQCKAPEPAHEAMRLFQPAAAQLDGQINMTLDD